MHRVVNTPSVTKPGAAANPTVIGKDSRGRWCVRAVERAALDGQVSPDAGTFDEEAVKHDLSGEPEPELEPEPKEPHDSDVPNAGPSNV